jgi:hypothetical protein
MVRNECVRFGGHVEGQVDCKILQLEVPTKASILHNLLCFEDKFFLGSFGLNVASGD